MISSSRFLIDALIVIAVPVALLRASGLKGLMPLVVVQILVGVAFGPSVFGRIAPDYFHLFAAQETLTAFSGVAFVAVLMFGMISGLHLDLEVLKGNAEPEAILGDGENRPKIIVRKGVVYVSYTQGLAKPMTGDIRFSRSKDRKS